MSLSYVLILLSCLPFALSQTTAQNVTRVQRDPLQLPDCADTKITISQKELANRADIVVTGITLAAGPGAGRCDNETGALNVALDNSTDPETNFVVLGIQCVHKGLLSCRNNPEDTKDCLILVAAPQMKDRPPCSLLQGERYMFYLQKQTNGCEGYYLTMYERVYHSVRRPLGGTGCTFYPEFPEPNALQVEMSDTCTSPVPCSKDACDPQISKSPCANDTSVTCQMKQCPGKWMWHNAIMPEDTCYEVYTYTTSGLPTNCYGRRYINNRIRQLAMKDPGFLGNMTANLNATDPGNTTSTTTAITSDNGLRSSDDRFGDDNGRGGESELDDSMTVGVSSSPGVGGGFDDNPGNESGDDSVFSPGNSPFVDSTALPFSSPDAMDDSQSDMTSSPITGATADVVPSPRMQDDVSGSAVSDDSSDNNKDINNLTTSMAQVADPSLANFADPAAQQPAMSASADQPVGDSASAWRPSSIGADGQQQPEAATGTSNTPPVNVVQQQQQQPAGQDGSSMMTSSGTTINPDDMTGVNAAQDLSRIVEPITRKA